MFNLSTSHLIQLLFALSSGIIIYVLGSMGFQRALFSLLIVIIPFQFIQSKYGSSNMAFTYILGVSLFINRSWMKQYYKSNPPLVLNFLAIGMVLFISWILAPRMFWSRNLFYLVMMCSNVIIFYICYYFIETRDDLIKFFEILFLSNILVIIYCIVQGFIGYQKFALLGINEFSLQQNRADQRVVGPFGSAGVMSEYIVIQSILLAYYVMTMDRYKKTALLLSFCNLAILLGTGNRGGFFSFILALVLFAFYFKDTMGSKKLITIFISTIIIFSSASFVMVKYTQYNVMYQRLSETEMDGFIPDTRSGWVYVVQKILEKPFVGHGPRLVAEGELEVGQRLPKGELGRYPHNLHLYILYTVGIVGWFVYAAWGIGYLNNLMVAKRIAPPGKFLSGLPKLGIIIFFVLLNCYFFVV